MKLMALALVTWYFSNPRFDLLYFIRIW